MNNTTPKRGRVVQTICFFLQRNYIYSMKRIITYTLLTFPTLHCMAKGIGNGSSGSASISGIVNKYAAVVSFNAQGTFTEFTVDTASVFAAGDLVLLIQMQGVVADVSNTANYGTIQNFKNTGNFEYVTVKSVSGSIVQTSKIQKSYDSNGKLQLVKVPQYKSVVVIGGLTGLPWNGKKGGIVAVDAVDTMTMQANIIANGLGFRGGTPKSDLTNPADDTDYVKNSYLGGMKGEGIAGRGDTSNVNIYGRGSIANGGGGGNNHNAGGGGGANGGCGGTGGWGYYSYLQPNSRGIGGFSLASAINNGKIFLGGGGGAGQVNDNFLSVPGNGGGIVIITAGTIAGNNNNIFANGTDGTNNNGYDGAAGGGAGGTVLLYADSITNLNATCKGGKGGDPKNFFNQHLTAPGGGGGGGLIRIKNQAVVMNVTNNVDSGAAGICDTSSYGALAGCKGLVFESLDIVHPPVSVGKLSGDQMLSLGLYPNPARDRVELTLHSGRLDAVRLSVYDVSGRQCYETVFEGYSKTIDVSQWKPGIYFFRVMTNDGAGIIKMVR